MIELNSRKECLFDTYLVDEAETTAEFRLHAPAYRGPVMVHDAPWEGNGCDYHNFFFDEDWHGVNGQYPRGTYRMYYLGWWMPNGDPEGHPAGTIQVCYAESGDGLTWEKPVLGLTPYEGSLENNLIFGPEDPNNFDNFMVFKDTNPRCPAEARYKGIAAWNGKADGAKNILRAYFSPDGLTFTLGPVITEAGYFDSLHIAFRDEPAGKYRLYFRGFHDVPGDDLNAGIRDIRTAESADFEHWSEPQMMDFMGHEDYPLYTSVVQPLPGAEHMLVGFPTRYMERPAWSETFDELTGAEARRLRMNVHPRYGLTVTDCVFMVSRDGVRFTRYEDAWMRPGPENGLNWMYGDAYPARGFFTAPSPYPGEPDELNMLIPAGHWANMPAVLNRYALRQDGFVSLHGRMSGQRVVTREFTYTGRDLFVNFSTSARGRVYFTLSCGEESVTSLETFGDTPRRRVRFAEPDAVARFAGKPVTLTAELYDADLYSVQFE